MTDWQAKAKKYREELESRPHMLITQPTYIRRMAMVRYKHVAGYPRYETDCETENKVTRHKLANQLRNLRRNGVKTITVFRYWECYNDDHAIQEWGHLCLAQAMRDGLNFHHASFLMTKDVDKWTSELSNR